MSGHPSPDGIKELFPLALRYVQLCIVAHQYRAAAAMLVLLQVIGIDKVLVMYPYKAGVL